MQARLPLILALAGLLAFAPTSHAAKAKPKKGEDDAPKLISTTGGGKSKWNSVEEIKVAADKGDPAACNEYAILLEQGGPVPKDFEKALTYYEKAAKAGVRESNFRLGTIYHDGLGVKQDYAKAFEYYKQAAQAGDSLAQYNIGSMLVSARGMKRDWVEGLAWVMVATQNGADADGEKQIRARLTSRPEIISAAEKRAKVLQAELHRPPGAPAPTTTATVESTSPAPMTGPVTKPEIPKPAAPQVVVPGSVPSPPPISKPAP